MNNESEEAQEYERMRGEYLSLVASLEFDLTLVLYEHLDPQYYREEFRRWFISVPIPS